MVFGDADAPSVLAPAGFGNAQVGAAQLGTCQRHSKDDLTREEIRDIEESYSSKDRRTPSVGEFLEELHAD